MSVDGRSGREMTGLPGEPMILAGNTIGGEPGGFSVDFVLWNAGQTASLSLNGVVDTRAVLTHLPEDVLAELGIEKWQDRDFRRSDGSKQSLPVGIAKIELEGKVIWIEVVFEPRGGSTVIGTAALTGAALAADAVNRKLVPGELLL